MVLPHRSEILCMRFYYHRSNYRPHCRGSLKAVLTGIGQNRHNSMIQSRQGQRINHRRAIIMKLKSYAVFCAVALSAASAQAVDQQRGKELHHNHCLACHGTTVYIRSQPLVTSYAELLEQVDFAGIHDHELIQLVENQLERSGYGKGWASVVFEWLKDILRTKLNGKPNFCLANIMKENSPDPAYPNQKIISL